MSKYRIRQACFACTTPYQVIGAISIVKGLDLDADLYIFGMFPDYEAIAERLEKQEIFHKVYAVDCTGIGAPGRAKGFLQMMFANRTVAFYLPKDAAYETYYSTSRALPKTILHRVLLQRNENMRHVIYEDGMGTYSADSHPLNPTKAAKVAERLLGWHLDQPEKIEMMAYLPKLVTPPKYLMGREVRSMPRLVFSEETKRMLEEAFIDDCGERIDERFIIFDTLRRYKDEQPDYLIALDKYYATIADVLGKEAVINKPHPRSIMGTQSDISSFANQSIPMEVLFAGMNDLEDRVLISHTSSAVFTPKILFDKEPFAICLHRLVQGPKGSAVFDEIFEKFKGTYRAPERVIAPRTAEELLTCLSDIQSAI